MSLKSHKGFMTQRPFFTHFASLPFIEPLYRLRIKQIQTDIRNSIHSHPKYQQPDILREHHHNHCHVTLFKLSLRHNHMRQKIIKIMQENQELIRQTLNQMAVSINSINYFTRFNKNEKCNQITVIYAEIDDNSKEKLNKMIDKFMRILLKEEIVASNELKQMNVTYDHNNNLYKPETLHISLFRARNLFEDEKFIEIFQELQKKFISFAAECHYVDISTMGKEFDETQFYLPLHRIPLKQARQPEKIEKREKMEQE